MFVPHRSLTRRSLSIVAAFAVSFAVGCSASSSSDDGNGGSGGASAGKGGGAGAAGKTGGVAGKGAAGTPGSAGTPGTAGTPGSAGVTGSGGAGVGGGGTGGGSAGATGAAGTAGGGAGVSGGAGAPGVQTPGTLIAYVQDGGKVHAYTVDRATGSMTEKSASVSICASAYNMKVTADQKYLFVACTRDGVAVVPIDAQGKLGTPKVADAAGAGDTVAVAITASGSLALGANYSSGPGSGTLYSGAGGNLQRLQKYNTGRNTHGATFDGLGKYAYIGSRNDQVIYQYAVNGNALTALTPATVTFPGLSDTQGPRYMTGTQNGKFIIVAAETPPNLYSFKVGTNGALTLVGDGVSAVEGNDQKINLKDVALSANQTFAYTSVCGNNTLAVFALDAQTGTLARKAAGIKSMGDCPTQIAVDPAGRVLLVTNNGGNKQVSVFSIDQTTGLLTFLKANAAAGDGAEGLAVVNLK